MKKLLALASFLVLAACGGAPSDSDINAAMKKQFDAYNKQMASIGAKGFADAMKLDSMKFKKIGCKEDGSSAYICDVEVSGPQGTQASPMRFVKGSDGWVASK